MAPANDDRFDGPPEMTRQRERYACAVDRDGAVTMIWDRSIAQRLAEQTPPAGEEVQPIEDPELGREIVRSITEEGVGHWFDRQARRFEKQRAWQPRGITGELARIGGETVHELAAPTDVVLEWDDPPGPVKLRLNGAEVLAASPFVLELHQEGRYVVEVTDARLRSAAFTFERRPRTRRPAV